MRVLAFDVNYDQAFLQANHVAAVSLDSLLAQSDFVSLHIPLTASGGRFLDREKLSLMKRGAILINTARGGLVDEDALFEALREGHLASAALDVFEHEPPRKTPLRTLPNVVLSPHNASYSLESMNKVADAAVEMVLALLAGSPEAGQE